MKRRISKFILAGLAHFVILIFVDYIIYTVLPLQSGRDGPNLFGVMVHIFFCTGYFLLLWIKLYDYDYHYFLNYSRDIILRSLVAMLAFLLSVIFLVYLFLHVLASDSFMDSTYLPERYFTQAAVILVFDIISFMILYAVQYFWIRHLIDLGYLKKNLLIIGEPDERFPIAGLEQGDATKIYQGRLFKRGSVWYFRDSKDTIRFLQFREIPNLLFENKIGEVIIFLCASVSQHDVKKVINYLTENSINYYLVPDIAKLSRETFTANSFPYVPIIRKFITKRDSMTQITFKRLFDIVFVVLSMLVVAPLCFVIALLIKTGDGGPVFYTHERVGKNGKIIKFFKFRTMVMNAESLKQTLLLFNQRGDGPLFKMKNDPRITRVGKMLRRTSLDELPQLLNVLKGDMSLVGPRPHLVTEVDKYSERDMLRLECIPGITCLPQVYGRDTATFRQWIDLDLAYRKSWSLALDLKILVRSLNVIISPFYRDLFPKT